MKKKLLKLFLGVLLSTFLLFIALPSHAILIGFDPFSQEVGLGESFYVDLIISELGDGVAPSLGAFDIDVFFDSSVLALDITDADLDDIIDSVVLDPTGQLDLFGFGMNLAGAAITGPGTLNVYDVSFDIPSDLNQFQAPAFTLATLTFDTISTGISPLEYRVPATALLVLGDAWGNELISQTTVHSGSITVAPVPEPATILLLISGMVGMGVFGRKKLRN